MPGETEWSLAVFHKQPSVQESTFQGKKTATITMDEDSCFL